MTVLLAANLCCDSNAQMLLLSRLELTHVQGRVKANGRTEEPQNRRAQQTRRRPHADPPQSGVYVCIHMETQKHTARRTPRGTQTTHTYTKPAGGRREKGRAGKNGSHVWIVRLIPFPVSESHCRQANSLILASNTSQHFPFIHR